MVYKLEHSSDEQINTMSNIMQEWSMSQPDLLLISKEGNKIFTHRFLFGLRNTLVPKMLECYSFADIPGISVAASSGSLLNLIEIISTGIARSNDKRYLFEVAETAKLFGIDLNNCQMGLKKRKCNTSDIVSHNNANPVSKDFSFKKSIFQKPKTGLKIEVEEAKDFIENVASSFRNSELNDSNASCIHCGKIFTSRSTLLRHLLVHTDNPKPFPCNLCEKRYNRSDRLRTHLANAHNVLAAAKTIKLMKEKSNWIDAAAGLNRQHSILKDTFSEKKIDQQIKLSSGEESRMDALHGNNKEPLKNSISENMMVDSMFQEQTNEYYVKQADGTSKQPKSQNNEEKEDSSLRPIVASINPKSDSCVSNELTKDSIADEQDHKQKNLAVILATLSPVESVQNINNRKTKDDLLEGTDAIDVKMSSKLEEETAVKNVTVVNIMEKDQHRDLVGRRQEIHVLDKTNEVQSQEITNQDISVIASIGYDKYMNDAERKMEGDSDYQNDEQYINSDQCSVVDMSNLQPCENSSVTMAADVLEAEIISSPHDFKGEKLNDELLEDVIATQSSLKLREGSVVKRDNVINIIKKDYENDDENLCK